MSQIRNRGYKDGLDFIYYSNLDMKILSGKIHIIEEDMQFNDIIAVLDQPIMFQPGIMTPWQWKYIYIELPTDGIITHSHIHSIHEAPVYDFHKRGMYNLLRPSWRCIGAIMGGTAPSVNISPFMIKGKVINGHNHPLYILTEPHEIYPGINWPRDRISAVSKTNMLTNKWTNIQLNVPYWGDGVSDPNFFSVYSLVTVRPKYASTMLSRPKPYGDLDPLSTKVITIVPTRRTVTPTTSWKYTDEPQYVEALLEHDKDGWLQLSYDKYTPLNNFFIFTIGYELPKYIRDTVGEFPSEYIGYQEGFEVEYVDSYHFKVLPGKLYMRIPFQNIYTLPFEVTVEIGRMLRHESWYAIYITQSTTDILTVENVQYDIEKPVEDGNFGFYHNNTRLGWRAIATFKTNQKGQIVKIQSRPTSEDCIMTINERLKFAIDETKAVLPYQIDKVINSRELYYFSGSTGCTGSAFDIPLQPPYTPYYALPTGKTSGTGGTGGITVTGTTGGTGGTGGYIVPGTCFNPITVKKIYGIYTYWTIYTSPLLKEGIKAFKTQDFIGFKTIVDLKQLPKYLNVRTQLVDLCDGEVFCTIKEDPTEVCEELLVDNDCTLLTSYYRKYEFDDVVCDIFVGPIERETLVLNPTEYVPLSDTTTSICENYVGPCGDTHLIHGIYKSTFNPTTLQNRPINPQSLANREMSVTEALNNGFRFAKIDTRFLISRKNISFERRSFCKPRYPTLKFNFYLTQLLTNNRILGLTVDNFKLFFDCSIVPQVNLIVDQGGDLIFGCGMDYTGSLTYAAQFDIQDAVKDFIDKVTPASYIEIVKFAKTFDVTTPLTNDTALLDSDSQTWYGYGGSTPMYDAIYQGILDIGNSAVFNTRQRFFITWSDCNDNDSLHTIDDVISIAKLYNVGLIFIAVDSGTNGTIERMADETCGIVFTAGGSSLVRKQELLQINDEILRIINEQYTLYFPTPIMDGKQHNLEVKVFDGSSYGNYRTKFITY